MPNYGTAAVDGVTLTQGAVVITLDAEVVDLDIGISSQVFRCPHRQSEVVVVSKRHKHRGVISGAIYEVGADTAKELAEALYSMLNDQTTTIALASRDFQASSVKFPGNYSIELQRSPVEFYRVVLPFVEVS